MNKYVLFIFLISSFIFSQDQLHVGKIEIYGNSELANKELLRTMKLKEPTLFNRTIFTPKMHKYDIQNLNILYKTNGFMDVSITSEHQNISNEYIQIIYNIKEGPQYIFSDINLLGNHLFPNEKILFYLKNRLNEYFNPAYIRKQLLEIKKEYLRHGHLNVNIEDKIIVKNNLIILEINISEGSQYSIQSMHILGLENINEKYVLRELAIGMGDIYNIDKIELSQKRIFDSNLFSSVQILPEIMDKERGYLNINIKIREYKSSSIEAEIGFSELSAWQNDVTTPGIDIQAQWSIGNILNTASSIIISSGLASEINFQSIEDKKNLSTFDSRLTYRSPWTLKLRFPSKFNIFYQIDNDHDENIKRFGVSHIISWDAAATSHYEFTSTYQTIDSDKTYLNQESEPVRSIEFIHTKNNVNNIIRPSNGYYLRYTSTLFGSILGGKRNFIKITNDFRQYFPLFKGTIAYRIKFGFIHNMNKNDVLPTYYTFKLGGQSSLRGWATPSVYDDGRLIYELINIEYRFLIFKKWGGELFIDSGRLYDTINKFSNEKFNWNYGFGMTYDTAIGPIRIEYAIPYGMLNNNIENENLSSENNKGIVHVSLLYMF